MQAALLAIGDEITGGLTIDTNSGFVAERLRAIGIEPVAGFNVPDDQEAIVRAFRRALEDADLAISTGGLGPTADDLTTTCVARLAGRSLVLHEPSLRKMEQGFRARGIEMTLNNRKQAMLPEGSTILPNAIGTAPGFICPLEIEGKQKQIVCMPGVPKEMRRMVDDSLVPWLQELRPGRRFVTRVFSTFGLPESTLDELLVGVVDPVEARLAFRAAFPKVQARITVEGGADEDLHGRLDLLERRVRERLGDHLYATADEDLAETVGMLLRERNLTLAVAESCTGGLIGHRITEVPGSSAYFLLGVIAYANEAKQGLLGVRGETLQQWGAVSTQTAEEMAHGVRVAANADLGISTTGIAGPGGGTPDKPVGTVCIGLAWRDGLWSRRYDLGERARDWIKGVAAQTALDRVRRHLLGSAGG